MSENPQQDVNQKLEREVDRLLSQLKYPPSYVARPRASRPVVRASTDTGRVDDGPSPAGVWARVVVGGQLAIGITQWPYSRACGVSLAFYLMVIIMVSVVGGWTGVASWKRRMGLAHVLALCLAMWGAAFAAAQVLPRVGYARAEASWMCGSEGS